jgi:hypothetical protein
MRPGEAGENESDKVQVLLLGILGIAALFTLAAVSMPVS